MAGAPHIYRQPEKDPLNPADWQAKTSQEHHEQSLERYRLLEQMARRQNNPEIPESTQGWTIHVAVRQRPTVDAGLKLETHPIGRYRGARDVVSAEWGYVVQEKASALLYRLQRTPEWAKLDWKQPYLLAVQVEFDGGVHTAEMQVPAGGSPTRALLDVGMPALIRGYASWRDRIFIPGATVLQERTTYGGGHERG